MDSRWYYYLHTNGELIAKVAHVVEPNVAEYFEGGFVVKYWLVEDRFSLMRMLVQAKKLGARESSITSIEKNQNVVHADYIRFMSEFTADKTLFNRATKRRR